MIRRKKQKHAFIFPALIAMAMVICAFTALDAPAFADAKAGLPEEVLDNGIPVLSIDIDPEEYQKIIDRYSDKNGKLSYDLMNKDFIRFAKSSSTVRDMITNGKSEAAIRNYIISHKIKNITGNDKLTSKELKKIVELLDEVSPRGVYKELNQELRKMIAAGKKK
jgi:hypothetical protein